MRLNEDSKLTDPPDLTPEQRKLGMPTMRRATRGFGKQTDWPRVSGMEIQSFMHDYLGCIKGVDDSVGRLLKYLDDTGLATNTIVIYSSTRDFFSANTDGSTSGGFSTNPRALRC